MFHTILPGDLPPNAHCTVTFRGEDYHAGISMFLGDDEPGQGARLHRHPYAETWIVRSGRAEIRAGDERFEAGPGDIVVVEAGTPHGFRNPVPGRLEMTCIHAAERMETEWLE